MWNVLKATSKFKQGAKPAPKSRSSIKPKDKKSSDNQKDDSADEDNGNLTIEQLSKKRKETEEQEKSDDVSYQNRFRC